MKKKKKNKKPKEAAKLKQQVKKLKRQLEAAEQKTQYDLIKQKENYELQLAEREKAAQTLSQEVLDMQALLQPEQEAGAAFSSDAPLVALSTRYSDFLRLPKERRDDLGHIVVSANPVSFLASGSQRNAAVNLWDYLRAHLQDLDQDEREVLTRTLKYFMDQYNALWANPVYEWMDGETGRPFDDSRHIRSADCSRRQGDITTVLLPGIWNRVRNSAERKCIVRY